MPPAANDHSTSDGNNENRLLKSRLTVVSHAAKESRIYACTIIQMQLP